MANYPINGDTNLNLTIDDIKKIRDRQMQYYNNPFEWKPEYLPVIIGVLGIGGIFLARNIIKKRKRKK